MKFLIVADDLSGAADCAAGCVAGGLRTAVLLDAAAAAHGYDVDVLALDMDSRRLSPQAAAKANAAVLDHCGTVHLYKKIDSTLRGNVAAEVAALQARAGMAIVAPAFPAAGRTVRDGCVIVHGVALEQTDIWRTESLAGRADLPAMLTVAGIKTAHLGLAEIARGVAAVRERLDAHARAGCGAVVCDGLTDDDLRTVAQASVGLCAPHFWVGSAGLSAFLPDALGLACDAQAHAETVRPSGPIVALIGSMSAIAREQLAYLREHAGPLAVFEIPPGALRPALPEAAWRDWHARIGAALARGQDVLISVAPDAQASLADGPRIAAALARLIEPMSERLGGLLATGGETARATLDAFGVPGLRLTGEVRRGLPSSVTLGPRPLHVVTKAGAFGEPDALYAAWRHLDELRAPARASV